MKKSKKHFKRAFIVMFSLLLAFSMALGAISAWANSVQDNAEYSIYYLSRQSNTDSVKALSGIFLPPSQIDDMEAINNWIINGYLVGYDADDSENWDFVVWDDSSPKKVAELHLKGKLSKNAFELDCSPFENMILLDLSNCDNLEKLYCAEGILASLDLSGCKNLREINCSMNRLPSLDVSDCASLEILICSNNALKTLNVSGCSNLYMLNCANNQLQELDLSQCVSIQPISAPGGAYTSFAANPLSYIKLVNDSELKLETNPANIENYFLYLSSYDAAINAVSLVLEFGGPIAFSWDGNIPLTSSELTNKPNISFIIPEGETITAIAVFNQGNSVVQGSFSDYSDYYDYSKFSGYDYYPSYQSSSVTDQVQNNDSDNLFLWIWACAATAVLIGTICFFAGIGYAKHKSKDNEHLDTGDTNPISG